METVYERRERRAKRPRIQDMPKRVVLTPEECKLVGEVLDPNNPKGKRKIRLPKKP